MCNILAGLFLVLAALFAFWGQWQQGKHEKMREWFRNKWSVIASSRWFTMPERVIRWVLDTRARIVEKIVDYAANIVNRLDVSGLLIAIAFLGCVTFWLQWGFIGGAISVITILPLAMGATQVIMKVRAVGPLADLIDVILGPKLVRWLYFLWLDAFVGGAAGIWFFWLLRLETVYATLAMILLLPVSWLFIFTPVMFACSVLDETSVYRRSWKVTFFIFFSMGVASSFSITLLALLSGHVVHPDVWVPQTAQMLISNVVCDGFTLVATFWILGWAVSKRGLLRIPKAILLDILVAGLLACCSLYFGLVFTKHGLSVWEVLRVLIGKSPERSGLEFGPYFWAMHTTFIPTVLYLLLIGACWMAKVILTVAAKFTKKALQHEKPCELTAALFGILFALFTALSLTLSSAEDWLQKHKQIEPPAKKVVESNHVGND